MGVGGRGHLAFLVAPQGFAPAPVLLGGPGVVGDELWTYGHPANRFRAGEPAVLTYQGTSQAAANRAAERVYGVPVGGGFSGSAVLDRRTGAVVGMISTSDQAGSAHLVPAATILAGLRRILGEDPGPDPAWLNALTDEQIAAGGWRHPGPQLRGYLDALKDKAATVIHLSDPRRGAPPLLKAYVRQSIQVEGSGAPDGEPAAPASLTAEQMLAGNDDVLVIGGPGIGKSTLLHALAHDAAARWLDGAIEPWVPVRIVASDLIERRSLAESIAVGVRRDLGSLAPGEGWSGRFFAVPPLPGARWLVLVDGVDEITHAAARREVLAAIEAVASARQQATYRFAIASRELPAGELTFQTWRPLRFTIEPFTPDHLAEFAQAWFIAMGDADPDALSRDFLAEVERVKLRELARTPLMAAILCQLFAQSPDSKLPARRPQLYHEFVALSGAAL
jgi:hypothetical protein